MFTRIVANIVHYTLQTLLWTVVVVVCAAALVFSFAFPPFAFVLFVAIAIKAGPRVAEWARNSR